MDASSTPTASTALVQARPLPGMGVFIPVGEVLLNLSSSVIFTRSSAPLAGLAIVDVALPNNINLIGFSLTIQSIIRSGTTNLTLCNALDCVIGIQPAPAPEFTADVSAGPAPLRVQFTDTSAGMGSAWSWNFGDGGRSDLQDPIYVYRNQGNFDVSLTVSTGGSSQTVTQAGLIQVSGNAADDNVLIILADDLGIYDLEVYGMNPNLPSGTTPNLDALASMGMLFENAWANPKCSPTRAMLLTGRYGFRTGIGTTIESSNISLRASELTLPEAIETYGDSGYSHAAFGKWHLSSGVNPDPCAVTSTHGFDFFSGTLQQVSNYCSWNELSCPSLTSVATTLYQPARMFDAASDWIGNQKGSWICFLAPQAPYELLHIPPASLQSLIAGSDCTSCPAGFERTCYLAAIQALDTKIGDLIASLGPNWEDHTTIIFAGDNGTPQKVLDGLAPEHGKGSLFEGGLCVPLIIAGKALADPLQGTRSAELIGLVDLYQTIATLTGTTELPVGAGEDSVDLSKLLQIPQQSAGRTSLFAEKFAPNRGSAPYAKHKAAIRDLQYKLIYDCNSNLVTHFYDLISDPLELNNLQQTAPPAPGTAAGDALVTLQAELLALIDC